MVKKAAENGNSHAQLELASRYEVTKKSPSILNNPEQAKYWYKKVIARWEEDAKNGDIAAQVALANSFEYGDNGTEIDIEKSEYWSKSAFEGFQKSFVKGNADLEFYLGNLYDFCDDDTQKVIQFFERPAKQGNLEAMQALIELYGYDDEGFCNDDFYDKKKAEYWQKEYDTAEFIRCKKAAEQGNASEQSTLGDYYAEGKGTDADSDKADFRYKLSLTGFKKAAEQGDARAQMEVARCYHDAKGVKVDKQTAFLWDKKAADQENNQAMKIVGDCYATGDGVEQSDEECLYWYRKAAEQGNQEAASQLPFKKAVVNKKIASSKYANVPFQMTIQKITGIRGRGAIVEGVIEKGYVRDCDKVTISKKDGTSLQSVVMRIEIFGNIIDYAEEGDDVKLFFQSISRKDISKGDVVTSLTASKDTKETLHTNESAKAENGNINPQLQYTSTVKPKTSSTFHLIVRLVSERDGIGEVRGMIDNGSIRINDEVIIKKADGTWFKSIVLHMHTPHKSEINSSLWDQCIWIFVKPIHYAEKGDMVCLGLKDTKMKDFSRDDVVTKE